MSSTTVARSVGFALLITTLLLMSIAAGFAVQVRADADQTPAGPTSQFDWEVNTISERVAALSERVKIVEDSHLDNRVTVLEHGFDEMRYWERGIAMAVLGQLVYMAFGKKKMT